MHHRLDFHLIYIFLAILFQAMSGVFLKYASVSSESIILLALNTFYLLAILCLVAQAVVWQIALKYYDLSFAYPFISLVNFLILLSSYLLFNESISAANILGLLIISAGIFLLSRDGVTA